MKPRSIAAISLIAVTMATVPLLAQQKPASGPIARYDMRAGTVSGVGAMGSGMGAGLGMMLGGGRGSNVQHELYLRLGSSNAPAKGGPKADHFMPAGVKVGKSVALVTPKEERGGTDEMPQKPKGRMLIYWGCGERAPKGQPVVIDFAKLAAGQVPPGLWSSTILRDWGPSLTNSRTFGRWPAEDGKYVKSDSALPGLHRVAGNYSPEMSFTLSKDFMSPLKVTATNNPSGSIQLQWGPIMDATGYVATLFGGKMAANGEMGDMVMWSSSASRQFGGGLSDWLSPGQVAALVKERTVLAPTVSNCTVPLEVKRDAPEFRFGTLVAFGPQEDFSYPPRPADPKVAWNLEWTARIRHRSMTTWMDMPGMDAMMGQQETAQQAPQQQPQQCKPKGLGGLLGAVVKGGC